MVRHETAPDSPAVGRWKVARFYGAVELEGRGARGDEGERLRVVLPAAEDALDARLGVPAQSDAQ